MSYFFLKENKLSILFAFIGVMLFIYGSLFVNNTEVTQNSIVGSEKLHQTNVYNGGFYSFAKLSPNGKYKIMTNDGRVYHVDKLNATPVRFEMNPSDSAKPPPFEYTNVSINGYIFPKITFDLVYMSRNLSVLKGSYSDRLNLIEKLKSSQLKYLGVEHISNAYIWQLGDVVKDVNVVEDVTKQSVEGIDNTNVYFINDTPVDRNNVFVMVSLALMAIAALLFKNFLVIYIPVIIQVIANGSITTAFAFTLAVLVGIYISRRYTFTKSKSMLIAIIITYAWAYQGNAFLKNMCIYTASTFVFFYLISRIFTYKKS